MSYQQGYPQQQQPSGMYQSGGYPPEAPGGGSNPATAIIAAVLGLVAAASLVVINVDLLGDLSDSGGGFGDLPGELKTIVILRFAGAAVLLAGLIVVLFRKLAGAFLLLIGALVAIAAILLYPVLLENVFPGLKLEFGEYLKGVFEFDGPQATFAAITLIAAPLALIMSILPPTFGYLRGSRTDDYPQQTYPQQPTW